MFLKAIRRGMEAWERDVSPSTIENCWFKSRALLSARYGRSVGRSVVLGTGTRLMMWGWNKRVQEAEDTAERLVSTRYY